ncbi:MAG TPA: glycosyltransferase family 4 protein [Pyrinomonadaceae bacterium]|jgi:glycosyltransferase involved in cell wall biosynthesis|nr:glycosyltransferase family 4 protein [Pyrinomonadaceae bacterium]
MKIALCKSHFFGPVSGADEILVTYAIRLRQAGHDVDVVLLYKPNDNDRFCRRLRQADVPIRHIIDRSIAFMILRSARGVVSSFLLLFLLIPRSEVGLRRIWQVLIDLISRVHYSTCRAYFSRSHFDLLHVFTPDTGAALMIRAGKEADIPVLYHEMGTPHHLPALDQYYRRLEKVLPLCSEVAALSPILANQWSERFPFLSTVSVLPLITEDCEDLNVSAKLIASPRAETIFGYAARIEAGKGPFVLADALAQVRQNRKNVLVRLAGTGPALQEVKARARELRLNGSWEFVGSYEGILGCSAFMGTLDVFVLPSFAEGTSKSIIEAMAHGLPIITTDVGGLPDLVTSDTGIMIPPGDSSALAEAMQRLASDPALRKRMGQAARARYLSLFSPDAVLPMLVGTYSRVTGNNGHQVMNGSANGKHPWAVDNNGLAKESTTVASVSIEEERLSERAS